MEKSNLLEAVFMALPAEHIMELAVKCRFYENVDEEDEEDIEYTEGFDDQESIDGKKEGFNPSHYFEAGMFKGSVAREFDRLTLTQREHLFVNAIGNHLCAYVADLKKTWILGKVSGGGKWNPAMRCWRTTSNYPKPTTIYTTSINN